MRRGSDLERGLELLQLIALFNRNAACFVGLSAGNFFFEKSKLCIELCRIELREINRLIGEDGKARWPHLGEAARHEEAAFP
jgi:hypothetical protein